MNEYVKNISESVRKLGFQVNETLWDTDGFDADYKTRFLTGNGSNYWQKLHIRIKGEEMEIINVGYDNEELLGTFPVKDGISILAIIGKNSL